MVPLRAHASYVLLHTKSLLLLRSDHRDRPTLLIVLLRIVAQHRAISRPKSRSVSSPSPQVGAPARHGFFRARFRPARSRPCLASCPRGPAPGRKVRLSGPSYALMLGVDPHTKSEHTLLRARSSHTRCNMTMPIGYPRERCSAEAVQERGEDRRFIPPRASEDAQPIVRRLRDRGHLESRPPEHSTFKLRYASDDKPIEAAMALIGYISRNICQ